MAQNKDEKTLLTLLARLVRVAEPEGVEISAALLAAPDLSAAALGCARERIEALRGLLDGAIAPDLGLRLKQRLQAAKGAKGASALEQAEASLLRASWKDAAGGFQIYATALFAVCANTAAKNVVFAIGDGLCISRAKIREVGAVIGKRAAPHALHPYALLTKNYLAFRFGAKGQIRFHCQQLSSGDSFHAVSLASLEDAPAPEVAPSPFGGVTT
jgi:hypothetical protein